MEERVQQWLEGSRNYWEGVDLYEAVGEVAFLKRLFRGSQDDYNHAKLTETLQAWLSTRAEQVAELEERMPEPLKNKKEVARRLMDERAALKERLRIYYLQQQPAAKLKEVAFEILNINARLDEIYSEERFWKQTGYLPEREMLGESTPQELIKRRLSLRTYVTKYRKAGKVEKLQRYEQELWEVEEKLKAHGAL